MEFAEVLEGLETPAVEAAGGLDVCDLCGFPAVRGADGAWIHGEVADGVFCALFHPRARGVGSGGAE
jgi:hypothetical protein